MTHTKRAHRPRPQLLNSPCEHHRTKIDIHRSLQLLFIAAIYRRGSHFFCTALERNKQAETTSGLPVPVKAMLLSEGIFDLLFLVKIFVSYDLDLDRT